MIGHAKINLTNTKTSQVQIIEIDSYKSKMGNDSDIVTLAFSVLGEELGFVGVISVVLFYMVFILLGFKLALTVKSKINTQLIAAIIFGIDAKLLLMV